MSGFAGILNLDGAPVDSSLLAQMTRSLAFRGPDAQETWQEGPVGFSHAMLRTTWEATTECQPDALDGRLRIVSDARIDARAELVSELNAKSEDRNSVSPSVPDSELILRAYDVWGDACVEHLLGDFSFAIWDARKRCLFCARDHFGIREFYYARIGNAFIFSNSLETLRSYPGCSSALCDAAIADFLLFGMNLHPASTPYEQILRLPRAHTLVASGNQIQPQRFWSFPIEEPLRYRKSREYVDQFRELLRLAVRDRLRCDRATICLSGGLDSPTVAAEAVAQLGAPDNLLGITTGFRQIVPYPEARFARIVAEYLKIPWHFIAIDDYKPFQRWGLPDLCLSRPADLTLGAMNCDFMDHAAEHGRVLLTGEGGDPGLVPSLSFYRGLGLFGLAVDVGKYILTHRRHPRLGFRQKWKRWRGAPPHRIPDYPCWLDEGLVTRLGLRDRWNEVMREPPLVHPYRPDSYSGLDAPSVVCYGNEEWCRRNVHVEVRHPLMDVRIQRFFLRLPVLPWCADKEILRVAMRDRLPKVILKRPKCPVRGNPVGALFREAAPGSLRDFAAVPRLRCFVAQERIPDLRAGSEGIDPEIDLRPINLNYWMSSFCDQAAI